MTTGKPMSRLIAFSVPLLIGNIAQQLYGTVDAIVVGNYIGDSALASVGAAGPIVNLLLVLLVGISVGASIMVSQYFGARDKESLSHTVGTALTLTFVASVLIAIAGALIARPALTLLKTPPELLDGATEYLVVIFVGIIGCAYYNILSGILRGLGDSVQPLIYLLIATVLNIFLDILFVATFHMGVAGVAYATIIAQAISAALCMYRLLHDKERIAFKKRMLKLDGALTKQLLSLGMPSGVTQAIFAMSAIMVQSLTNSFGEAVIACNVAIMRVDGFAMMPNFTFAAAITTFAGQNIGARQLDRVDQGTRDGLKLGLLTSLVLTGCILIFGRAMISLFTSTDAVIDLGVQGLRILAAGYIAMSVTQVLGGTMRGAGDTVTPMWLSIVTTVVIRVPIAYLLVALSRTEANPLGDPRMLFASLLISWVLGMLLHIVFYRIGKWRGKSIVKEEAPVV